MIDKYPLELQQLLDHINKRPGMYMSDDLPTVVNFLTGLRLGLRAADSRLASAFEQQIASVEKTHGWAASPSGAWTRMRERGLDDKAIMTEILSIYAEAWDNVIADIE